MKNENQVSWYSLLKRMAAVTLVMLFMFTATLNTFAQGDIPGENESIAVNGDELTYIPLNSMAAFSETYSGSVLHYYSNDGRSLTATQYIPRMVFGYLYGSNDLQHWAREGYTLEGWSWNRPTDRVDYQCGRSWMGAGGAGQVEHLYAVWKKIPETYTITYNNNNGTGSINSQQILEGFSLSLSGGSGFSRPGYQLIGWSISPGDDNLVDYSLTQTVRPAGNMTLYAVWQ